MGFQTEFSVYRGVGKVGEPASTHPIVAFAGGPDAFRAADAGVTIGTFVFADADDATIATNVAPTTTSVPLGFVQNLGQAIIGYGESKNMLIPGGKEVSPKVAGDFWAVAAADATRDQAVFASVTDGSITVGADGATVDGYVQTQFFVSHGASAGDLIIISRWSK